MRFGSVVFSISNSIIGMRSQTSEVSSSVVYTATIAWSVGEPRKVDRYLHVRRLPWVERRDLVEELLCSDAGELGPLHLNPGHGQVLLPGKVIEIGERGVGREHE